MSANKIEFCHALAQSAALADGRAGSYWSRARGASEQTVPVLLADRMDRWRAFPTRVIAGGLS